MNILNFLKNIETDFNGRFIEDIWNYSSNEIEYNHDFIQLLFPLDKPSESVFHGVYLKSKNEINEIKNDDLAKLNIIKSSKWFLIFLKNCRIRFTLLCFLFWALSSFCLLCFDLLC